MRLRSTLYSIVTVVVLTITVAVATGFTIVVHACHECGVSSVHTVLNNNAPAIPADCCCQAHSPESEDNSAACSDDCCDTEIKEIKIINFFPVYTPEIHSYLTMTPGQLCSEPETNQYFAEVVRSDYHEKYGGRQIVTFSHRLII